MTARFIPPFPKPHRSKASLARRFVTGWTSWIHTLFEKSYTMKLGDIRLPGLDFFIANDPAIVARVMDDPGDRFPKHPLLREMLDPLIGNSLFSANGADWAEQRAMVTPAFAHTNLQRSFPVMRTAVDDMIARIHAQDRTRPIDIDPHMTHVAADIIFRTLFSVPLGAADAAEIFDAFNAYQRGIQPSMMLRIYRLPLLGYRRRAIRAARRIHALFEPIVAQRHAAAIRGEAGGEQDILAALLDARHPQTGARFTVAQLIDQISTIFLAGHETSASVMTWALYLIAESPDLQQAIRDEIGDGPLDHARLRDLPLVRDVFRETLRLYPPVSFFIREVTTETVMRRKTMKPGSMIVISPWLIHRNANHWRCPHGFRPERFSDPAEADACRHAYMPFGRGPRICIGAGFAQQEGLLVLAAMVRAFRLESPANDKPTPVSRLTTRPRHGLRLMLTRTDG